MFRLFVVRHGQTDHNLHANVVGQDNRQPLNETGTKQAEALGKRLARENFQYGYISPYKRAQQTYATASSFMKPFPVIHPYELREYSPGDAFGKPLKEIWTEDTKKRFQTFGMAAHHGGGESLFEVGVRLSRFLQRELISENVTGDHLLVSHANTIRSLLHLAMNYDHKMAYRIAIDNCSLSVLRFDGDWYVDMINNTSHLENNVTP